MPKKYEVPDHVEIDLDPPVPNTPATMLHVQFLYREEGVPLYFERISIKFNIDPLAVPEDGVVKISTGVWKNQKEYKREFKIDLVDMLAAGIAWEMTLYTILKLTDLETAINYDEFIMWSDSDRYTIYLPTASSQS